MFTSKRVLEGFSWNIKHFEYKQRLFFIDDWWNHPHWALMTEGPKPIVTNPRSWKPREYRSLRSWEICNVNSGFITPPQGQMDLVRSFLVSPWINALWTIKIWIWLGTYRSQLDFRRIPLDFRRIPFWLKTLAESYGGHWEWMGKSKEKNIRDMGVD